MPNLTYSISKLVISVKGSTKPITANVLVSYSGDSNEVDSLLRLNFPYILSLFRKKSVRAAAIKKWPGNSPNFKKSTTALQELATLVDELHEDCSYPPVGFCKPQIRQHILDIWNKRRNIREGHDYTQVQLLHKLTCIFNSLPHSSINITNISFTRLVFRSIFS